MFGKKDKTEKPKKKMFGKKEKAEKPKKEKKQKVDKKLDMSQPYNPSADDLSEAIGRVMKDVSPRAKRCGHEALPKGRIAVDFDPCPTYFLTFCCR